MGHLSTDDILDLADGSATPATAQAQSSHLAACAQCTGELQRVQAALAIAREASSVEVPEPSPLFWDHLSARVREAVAAEPAPRAASWIGLRWGWSALIPIAAAAVIVLAVSLRLGSNDTPPASQRVSTAASVANGTENLDASRTSDDPALALLGDLAGDFEWDDVADAGLMAGSGAIDRAMSELSDAERVELHRLLNEELKQWKTPGA
jgi:anti-sigma factor RsiW